MHSAVAYVSLIQRSLAARQPFAVLKGQNLLLFKIIIEVVAVETRNMKCKLYQQAFIYCPSVRYFIMFCLARCNEMFIRRLLKAFLEANDTSLALTD